MLGVTNGRPESRRPAGVGRPDARVVLAGVLAGPEGRRAGVLWATLPADVQDCSLCAPENLGVVLSPRGNAGILN